MKILIVCSGNFSGPFEMARPFINEQVNEVQKLNPDISFFFIQGKGLKGYLKALPQLKRKLREEKTDLIHAHNGLSGALSSLQRKVPVVITFHGTDINNSLLNMVSSAAGILAEHCIFVSEKLLKKVFRKPSAHSVIPCGVNLENFYPMDKDLARAELGLEKNRKYILFASSFDNPIKNYPLAAAATKEIPDVTLLELKGRSRKEVNLLLNAVDLLLLTSFSEGSPQVVKEALATNCPVVATNVGDISEILQNINGCYVTDFDPVEIREKIKLIFENPERTNGRSKADIYNNKIIGKQVYDIYQKLAVSPVHD